MINQIVDKIRKASRIVLSTHRHCDGDGLGAQIALFHALKKTGKKVRILNVDETPRRYSFLHPETIVGYFEGDHDPLQKSDLALIFDTNDHRLVEPLFGELKKNCQDVLFVDHHPVLNEGPEPTQGSLIDVTAASTGELVYHLIKALGISLDAAIARALYTSIVFDTQLFRFIRSSPASHLIAAELLAFEKKPEEVHRCLFANYSAQKLSFLAKALGQIEYFAKGRLAVLRLHAQDLLKHELELDESRDVIDLIMNIECLEAAALFREDGPDMYKLSLRSKNELGVLAVAESIGGGGHPFSAGAYLTGSYELLKETVVSRLLSGLSQLDNRKNEPA